jgi:hypothetical protein
MAMTAALTENSRQGINFQIPPCIGPGAALSPNLRPGCGHAYDETAVGLVVYVRNDPVNYVDPDGKFAEPLDVQLDAIRIPTYYLETTFKYTSEDIIITGFYLRYGYTLVSPPGGSSAESWRASLLSEIRGQNDINIKNRIGEPGTKCYEFLQIVINNLGQPGLKSPADLLQNLAKANIIVMGENNPPPATSSSYFGPGGSTFIQAASANTISGNLWGQTNTLYFGWRYFYDDPYDKVNQLIHESFHLFSGRNFLSGLFSFSISDDGLAHAAKITVPRGQSPSKLFQEKLDQQCK